MVIFKPLKGTSSRIATSITPLHEGWMYLTVDDKKLYADVENASGTVERMCLNNGGGCTSISATLSASGWSNGVQTLSVSGVKAASNGMVGLPSTATTAQAAAAQASGLKATAQAAGSITITASGTAPTVDIPVLVVLFD